ncbi:unnamed protein product [Diatraea saccharalis]|uniref:Enhancer of mRNA-decapping protein 4 C-terminal domain-containing protein n=1 Tax=Diatraea saccharalis TaxID=40085 RepID=A0A9N9QWB3_9NEOP|nr:unnamed protein product [Diatraea saccharalis]
MQAALINKQMEEGDVNGSFERALCAGDLTLVVAACRAAAPAAPSRLQQHVLLALLQQLATDMLHDTILKCRSTLLYHSRTEYTFYFIFNFNLNLSLIGFNIGNTISISRDLGLF